MHVVIPEVVGLARHFHLWERREKEVISLCG